MTFNELKINRKYKIYQQSSRTHYYFCRLLKVEDCSYTENPKKLLYLKLINSSSIHARCGDYAHEKGMVATFTITKNQLDKFELIND